MDGLMVHYKLWRSSSSSSSSSSSDTKSSSSSDEKTRNGNGNSNSNSNPAIVLLHGFGGSVFSWKRSWRGLTDISHTVLAFDRPGFGLTTRLLPTTSGDYGTYRDEKVILHD
jgi:pimeloyl-ACP methyl ester carboxylesterase